mgnify:CR=1
QEEAGCLCTSVEGIEAEVEANNFGVQMLLQLLKLLLGRGGRGETDPAAPDRFAPVPVDLI